MAYLHKSFLKNIIISDSIYVAADRNKISLRCALTGMLCMLRYKIPYKTTNLCILADTASNHIRAETDIFIIN